VTINERAALDCKFYGHQFVGLSNCVYCNTPQKGPGANGINPETAERPIIGEGVKR
jgi:hypothetical protein